jgi:hypothetical protein
MLMIPVLAWSDLKPTPTPTKTPTPAPTKTPIGFKPTPTFAPTLVPYVSKHPKWSGKITLQDGTVITVRDGQIERSQSWDLLAE